VAGFRLQALILYVAILTIVISLNGGLALAGDYTVSWWHLQKRNYEDGRSFNRLGFGVVDASGSPVSTDVVLNISLVGSGVPDPLPEHSFDYYDALYGRIDTTTGLWIYDADFTTENYHAVNFSGNLAAGNYTFTVIDEDGETMTNDNPTQYFNGVVELPTISSKSFRGYEDASGNWTFQWDPPMDSETWSGLHNMSIRCWISIFLGDDYKGDIYVTVPAALGGMYVPSNVMDLARQIGDNGRFALHLRTNDNNNRYYTNSVGLSDLNKERPSKTVVIPLL